MRIIQTCEKLSKTTNFFKNLSKKLRKYYSFFKKKKNDLLKNKINQKNKRFRDRFFFSNYQYFLIYSRSSFIIFF